MRMWRWMKRGTPSLLCASLALAGPIAGQESPWHDYEALSSAMRDLARSDHASIESIARTMEGRDVWMLRLAADGPTPIDERPGVLVVANLSADHLVGSSIALASARRVLERAESEAEVRELLQRNVLYIVPRANPDGAEAFFGDLDWDRPTNARPVDDDNDGRVDEDAPNDLNGDGMITVMRVMDPEGDFIVHPDDERLMKRADATAGEVGRYTLHWEGIDDDGDGFLNEDLPGGVDLDRNFQHEYPYYQAYAGPHMVSEPETRALIDFAVANRNIGAILTFGHHDNLVTAPNGQGRLAGASLPDLHVFAAEANGDVLSTGVYGTTPDNIRGGLRLRGAQPGRDNDPQSGRRPQVTVDAQDIPYFEAVAEAYGEHTGLDATPLNRTAEGAFFQFGYYQFGVPSFSTQGWALPTGEGDDAPAGGATLEQIALSGAQAVTYVPWASAAHPQFGQVEIGGFAPGAMVNPVNGISDEHGAAQGDFLVDLAGMLPRISIVESEVTDHGGGIFTVEAVVENAGYFPTALRHGVVSRSVQQTMVQIGVDADDIVTGDDKTARIPTLAGSGHRARFSWVIRGSRGDQVELYARAQKGGTDTVTVTLR